MDYGFLARSYNTLHYSNQLKDLLNSFYSNSKYNSYSKRELHKVVNKVLLKNYEGEEILKYKLANTFKSKNYIAAFEVKVNSSRADFLVINGVTRCFEVKSKIDTLKRLPKQIKDYGDVFEYNTVVIDLKHLNSVIKILPDHYGIWFYEKTKKIEYREAKLSPFLNSKAQLNLLTKRELFKYFGSNDVDLVLEKFTSVTINHILKEILKQRYLSKWQFVKDNWNEILPIDLQFFYATNVSPELIYSN